MAAGLLDAVDGDVFIRRCLRGVGFQRRLMSRNPERSDASGYNFRSRHVTPNERETNARQKHATNGGLEEVDGGKGVDAPRDPKTLSIK